MLSDVNCRHRAAAAVFVALLSGNLCNENVVGRISKDIE